MPPKSKSKSKSGSPPSKGSKGKRVSVPSSIVPEIIPHWIETRHIVSRVDLVNLSGYCKETERYNDMAEAIRRIVKNAGENLNRQEQDYFFVAFNKSINEKRFSYQVLTEIIKRIEGCDKKATTAIEYRAQIIKEIEDMSLEVIKLIEEYLLPLARTPVDLVFYYKTMGDFNRYICEVTEEDKQVEQFTKTQDIYDKAIFHAERNLSITDDRRLGLFMNYGVFFKEILKDFDKSIRITQINFDQAMEKIEKFDDPIYKDTIIVLQYMRDNISRWNREQDRKPIDVELAKKEAEEAAGKDSKSKKSDKKKDSPKKNSPKKDSPKKSSPKKK